mgnify:CR=1 FL=1
MSVQGRVALVSGAAQGIGRAIAVRLAAAGAFVALLDRDGEGVEAAAAELKGATAWGCDVRDSQEVRATVKRIFRACGPIDLLINNAAIINRNSRLVDVPAAEFDAVIDINIKGVANVTRHFAPAMIERNHGVIVNLSSGWGRSTSPEVAPYCATKWAMEGLSKAMAEELPSGMACVPLSPGVVNTEMLQSCFGDGADSARKPNAFAQVAAPFLLALGPKDNGQSLTVPS